MQTRPNNIMRAHNHNTVTVRQCPECREASLFMLIDIEHWPRSVTERLGFAPEVMVWRCENCKSIHTMTTPIHKTG